MVMRRVDVHVEVWWTGRVKIHGVQQRQDHVDLGQGLAGNGDSRVRTMFDYLPRILHDPFRTLTTLDKLVVLRFNMT